MQNNTNGNASLQALTLAISPKGINTFFSEALSLLLHQSFIPPDKSGIVTNQFIPLIPCTLTVETLDLSGGTLSQIATTLKSIQQNANGLFQVNLNASFHIAYSNWHEKGYMNCPPPCQNCMPPPPFNFDQTLSDFWFTISSIDLSFDVQLAETAGQWTVVVSNAAQSNVSVTDVHVPKKSNLNNPSIFPCINDKIKDKMKQAITDVNFAANLQTALSGLFKTIPTSGVIFSSGNNSIVYQFPATYIQFPGNTGIEAGITGQVVCNGTSYSGQPVTTPVAPVIVTNDINVFAGVYEFNALLWAFYTCNELQRTILPSTLPDPRYLNTNFYKILLPQLYNFAPGADMTVDISATEPPVVSTGPVYYISAEVLSDLIKLLPTSTYTTLAKSTMVGVVYPNLTAFNATLQNTLTSADFKSYSTIIDNAAETTGLFTVTKLLLVVNVLKQDTPVFAFSFEVEKDDILLNLQLGVLSKNVQTIKFVFSEFNSKETLVKSAIGDISGILGFMWDIVNFYADELLQKAGDTGIPLPLISGFLLENASIGIQNNYVSLATDVVFGNMNQYTSENLKKKSLPSFSPVEVFRLKKPVDLAVV